MCLNWWKHNAAVALFGMAAAPFQNAEHLL
jgi:hypothetical protein